MHAGVMSQWDTGRATVTISRSQFKHMGLGVESSNTNVIVGPGTTFLAVDHPIEAIGGDASIDDSTFKSGGSSTFTRYPAPAWRGVLATVPCSLSVKNTNFVDNQQGSPSLGTWAIPEDQRGGGALFTECNTAFENVQFLRNHGTRGGAVAIGAGATTVSVKKGWFWENTAALDGGALVVVRSSSSHAEERLTLKLRYVYFTGNRAKNTGGAISDSVGGTNVIDAGAVAFQKNTSDIGAGMYWLGPLRIV